MTIFSKAFVSDNMVLSCYNYTLYHLPAASFAAAPLITHTLKLLNECTGCIGCAKSLQILTTTDMGMTLMIFHSLLVMKNLVSFPDPAFTKDKGLAHFARNLGLADSALPKSGEPIRLLILSDHVVRIALPKRTLESCDWRNSMGL